MAEAATAERFEQRVHVQPEKVADGRLGARQADGAQVRGKGVFQLRKKSDFFYSLISSFVKFKVN